MVGLTHKNTTREQTASHDATAKKKRTSTEHKPPYNLHTASPDDIGSKEVAAHIEGKF